MFLNLKDAIIAQYVGSAFLIWTIIALELTTALDSTTEKFLC